jgi:hypothetical protein
VSIGASEGTDAASNPNEASNSMTIRLDTVRPNVVSISSTEAYDTNLSPVPVTVVFDEAVTGFVVGDVTVTTASASALVASANLITWVISLTPQFEAVLTARVGTGTLTGAISLPG